MDVDLILDVYLVLDVVVVLVVLLYGTEMSLPPKRKECSACNALMPIKLPPRLWG